MDVFAWSDEAVRLIAELRPITATFWGVPGDAAAWDDLSPEGHARVAARLEQLRSALPRVPGDADAGAQLAHDVLVDHLEIELDRYAHGDYLADLNSIASPFQMVRMVLDVMDAGTRDGWLAKARRLETLDAPLEGYRRTLALGLETGRTVAARQVRAAIAQGRVHAGADSYFRTLPALFDQAQLAGPRDEVLRARIVRGAEHAARAYEDLTSWLEGTYLPRAREQDGVGSERYVRDARRHLGMALDAEETYAWGFRELAGILEAMRSVASRVLPGASVAETLSHLRTEPSRCSPDPDAFLDLMRARQAEAMEQLLGSQFDVPDAVRALDVKLAPPGGPLGAYYVPPSDGFARAGSVWYSLGDARPIALFDQIATAYHEGFPGHHLQIGIQLSLTSRLSRLHRVADGYSGYAEGWALYAEQLMAELGYYERPEYELGMLACQLVRACRVVIDIGAHLGLTIPRGQPFHPGEAWTFDLGVEMLTSLAGLDGDRAASEMTRYLGWPGQAITYKVGQRVMLELRAEERARLGAAFDARAFHARVLGCGNVGLDHLRRLVRAA